MTRQRGESILITLFFLFSYWAAGAVLEVDTGGLYGTIQSAINEAMDGDTILVHPGIYVENIELIGHDIILTSENPDNWTIVEQTIIKAGISQSVVTLAGTESPSCILEGLTIQDGFTSERGGGIQGNGSYASIRRCIIRNNTALHTGGGLQSCHGIVESCFIVDNTSYAGAAAGCHGVFSNCVLANNYADVGGLVFNNCDGLITLCTIVNNTGTGEAVFSYCNGIIENCILQGNQTISFSDSSIPSHCCFPDSEGSNGNINLDPQFIFPGDYRLRAGSPCIDAGTGVPSAALPDRDYYGQERLLDGNGLGEAIVDMGVSEFDAAGPLLVVSDTSFAFTSVDGQGTIQSSQLLITNAGGGTCDWTVQGPLPGWLTAEPMGGTCIGGDDPNVMELVINTEEMDAGRYLYDLVLFAPQAVNTSVTVDIELLVVDSGKICVPNIFATIQEAIDAAGDGSRIVVADGVYTGPYNRNLDFCGKQIVLESENGPENCIIDCQELGRGFYFHNGEDENSVVRGFTIRNGYVYDGSPAMLIPTIGGGGIMIRDSSPSIQHCIFLQNNGYSGNGGGINLYNSSSCLNECTFSENSARLGGAISIVNNLQTAAEAVIKNCIVSGNEASRGSGIYSNTERQQVHVSFCTIVGNRNFFEWSGAGIDGENLRIKNCILWGNGDGNEYEQISSYSNTWLGYCCVQGWTGNLEGVGNIGEVPKFVRPGYWSVEGEDSTAWPINPDPVIEWIEGDYHLRSEGWRRDSQAGRWTYDDVTSPCIDTGCPTDEPGDEYECLPMDPMGFYGMSRRVNMGAYGQTNEASLGPGERILLTDMTNDGRTNLDDLIIFADRWLRHDYHPFVQAYGTDFTRDNAVNLADLACLNEEWMKTKPVKDPIAYWTFDEDWQDTTGIYPATVEGEPLINRSFYKVGSGAAYFDGVDDRTIIEGFKGITGQHDRTVCFWMNSSQLNNAMVGWGSNESESGSLWEVISDTVGDLSTLVKDGRAESGIFITDGQWHHIAVVLDVDGFQADTGDIYLYIDGERIVSTIFESPVDTHADYDVSIGWFPGHVFYQGFIDDLRIYDIALNQWQIADLAANGNE